MFRVGAKNSTFSHGEWAAIASVLTVTNLGDKLKMFAVQNARSLRRGTQTIFSSESLTNVAVNYQTREIEAICNTEIPNRINLFVGKKPVRVLLDGRVLNANEFTFNPVDNTISLAVPSKQHKIQIIL